MATTPPLKNSGDSGEAPSSGASSATANNGGDFPHEEVHELARTYTRQSQKSAGNITGTNPFDSGDSRLDPNSPDFNSRQWTQTMMRMQVSDAGIMFGIAGNLADALHVMPCTQRRPMIRRTQLGARASPSPISPPTVTVHPRPTKPMSATQVCRPWVWFRASSASRAIVSTFCARWTVSFARARCSSSSVPLEGEPASSC